MGEMQKDAPLRVDFDSDVKVRFVGGKVVGHSCCIIFQMAQLAVPRELFAATLGRIGRLLPDPT